MSRAPKSPPKVPRLSRRDRALATRRRMLQATYDLVTEIGYGATTMAAIAERAGVAEQTLYFTFHTKPAILSEVLHASVVGFERWTPSLHQEVRADHRAVAREQMPWFGPFEDESDPRRALEHYVDGTAEIWARVGPLLASLGTQPGSDLAATLTASERLREEASAMLVGMLAKKGSGLRSSLTRRAAVDVFHVLTRGELYFDLTTVRGWSHARAKRWLLELLARELLADP